VNYLFIKNSVNLEEVIQYGSRLVQLPRVFSINFLSITSEAEENNEKN
jgi:hypothetical protein